MRPIRLVNTGDRCSSTSSAKRRESAFFLPAAHCTVSSAGIVLRDPSGVRMDSNGLPNTPTPRSIDESIERPNHYWCTNTCGIRIPQSKKEFYRPAGCASQLTGPGCEVADCTPSAPSTVARHWARDWRALALTQVHHGSRLSDSREGGTARHLLSSERALARPPPPHHRQAHSQSLCDCRDQRIFQRMYF